MQQAISWSASTIVGLFTLGFGGVATFRLLVSYFTRDFRKKSPHMNEIGASNQPTFKGGSAQYNDSPKKVEIQEAYRKELSRRVESLLTEEQKKIDYDTLDQDSLIAIGEKVATDVGRVSFLYRPASDGKKMREWANKTFLPDHVDVEQLQKELLENHIQFDLEELGKLAASVGNVRTLPKP